MMVGHPPFLHHVVVAWEAWRGGLRRGGVLDDYFSLVIMPLWTPEQQFSTGHLVLHQPRRPRMTGPALRTDTTMPETPPTTVTRRTRPSRACRLLPSAGLDQSAAPTRGARHCPPALRTSFRPPPPAHAV